MSRIMSSGLTLALLLNLFPAAPAFARIAVVRPMSSVGLPGNAATAVNGSFSVGIGLAAPGSKVAAGDFSLSPVLMPVSTSLTIEGAETTSFDQVPAALSSNKAVAAIGPATNSPASASKTFSTVSSEQPNAAAPTLISRLSAAVAGISRMGKLQGSKLKAAAGKDFDDSSLRSKSKLSPVLSGVKQAGSKTLALLSPNSSRAKGKDADSQEIVADFAARDAETPAPKQKIWRAVRIGALTAILMLALDMAVMAAATSMGYAFHPSYEMPALADPAAFAALGDFWAPALAKVQEFFMAAWAAPFNEEIYFRAGVIGLAGYGALKSVRFVVRILEKIRPKFAKLRSWITPAAFGLAATEAALFFALLHEMSDPILIAVRITQALLFSYLYVREGVVSGITHHATFNGLAILTLPLVYSTAAGSTVFLASPAMIVAGVLAAALLVLWKITRSTAKKEAGEMRAGRLAPYRLNAEGSTWLARAGWVTVAVLAGLAAIQPTAAGVLMIGAMAAQVAPAALALQAYAFLLRNLKKRKGAAAVSKITNPESPLPLGNRLGAWVGGAFGAMYLALFATPYLLMGVQAVVPGLSLLATGLLAGGIALIPVAGIAVYRWVKRHEGISPWVYLAQYFFASAAGFAATVHFFLPALESLVASAEGTTSASLMPAFSAMLWTIPVFIVLAVLMTLIGRALMKKYSSAHPGPLA